MKTIITFLVLMLSLSYAIAQTDSLVWQIVSPKPTTNHIYGLQFINDSTGYIATGMGSNGTILKTTDKSNTWNEIYNGNTGFPNSVFFVDSNTGYFAGGRASINYFIQKTTDGGKTWNTQLSGSSKILQTIFFLDSLKGYAVGQAGLAFMTIDGGKNWNTMIVNTTQFLYDCFFIDSIGYIVGDAGVILKTIDGGLNWTNLNSGTTAYLSGVSFSDVSTGYATGNNGTILKTLNGGTTWTPLVSNTIDALNKVFIIDSESAYITSNSNILKTIDGGTTWKKLSTGTTESLLKVYFPNPDFGLAVGTNGIIVKAEKYIPSPNLDSGLVASYPFNGNANDASNNGNNGTVNGATLTADRFGNVGMAYSFDGVSNSIIIPNSTSINLSSNEMTISYWIKWINDNSDGTFKGISKGGFDLSSGYELLYRGSLLGDNGYVQFINNNGSISIPNTNQYQNQWINIISVLKNGKGKIFINGIASSVDSIFNTTNLIPNNNDLYIGTRDPSNNYVGFVKGSIDDIRIYNRALILAEIDSLYHQDGWPLVQQPKVNLDSGLVAYYPFNGNANDESSNGNNGIVNGATLSTDRSGNANSAYNFDGNDSIISTNTNNFPIGKSDRSISLWIKSQNYAQGNKLIIGWGLFDYNKMSSLCFGYANAPDRKLFYWGFVDDLKTQTPLIDNRWYHIVYTYSSNQGSIYINDTLSIKDSVAPNTPSGSSLHIGNFYNTMSGFNGIIDDIRIYNRALTKAEIDSLYSQNGLPQQPKSYAVYDIDSNGYDTVKIGKQIWMKENLKTSKYQNGDIIPNVTDNTTWTGLTTGARCYYNNDSVVNAPDYGALYNWYTVNDSRGVCPTGWHVPSDVEWDTLINYLGGSNIAGGKIKESGTLHWQTNIGATNESNFSAIPSGYRLSTTGIYENIGSYAYFWTLNESSSSNAYTRYLQNSNTKATKTNNEKEHGLIVRCLKNGIDKPTCSATFTLLVDTLSGTVTYTNTTTGKNKYYWIYDDGDYSNVTSPTHKYSNDGIYRVSLTATDTTTGCQAKTVQEIKIKTVTIEPCRAAFNLTIDSIARKLTCSNNSTGTALSRYYWEFGDGSLTNNKNPLHTYNSIGYYIVSLTVIDTTNKCADNKSIVINITDSQKPCRADFTYTVDLTSQKIIFANKSDAPANAKYIWDFNDNQLSTLVNPEHQYNKGGYYDVCLTIKDSVSNCRNTFCQNLKASELPTFCHAQFSYSVDSINGIVDFYDKSKGKHNGWDWNYGDGTNEKIQNGKHKYNPGYYTVRLKISDSETGCKSFNVAVINIQQPQKLKAGFGYENINSSNKGVLPVEFKGAGYGDESEVEWDFGDGSINNSSISPTHEYKTDGTYNACLTVSNTYTGESDKSCQQIVVIVTGLEKQTKNSSITIYPNPAKQSVTITFNSTDNVKSIEILNTIGQTIISKQIKTTNKAEQLDISSLQQGIYFIKVQTDNGNIIEKIIKQ